MLKALIPKRSGLIINAPAYFFEPFRATIFFKGVSTHHEASFKKEIRHVLADGKIHLIIKDLHVSNPSAITVLFDMIEFRDRKDLVAFRLFSKDNFCAVAGKQIMEFPDMEIIAVESDVKTNTKLQEV